MDDRIVTEQINQCLGLLKEVLGQHLLGVYLYGSAVFGGLQKYSDVDLLVVSERSTTIAEKGELVKNLLQISGVYMKSVKLPIELTIVVKSEINPWHYPPTFDFQYGDWLRESFASGVIEPWPSKVMPDLAILVTQVLLANKTLFGPNPGQLLSPVPYRDFIKAITAGLKNLKSELDTDTRNVLLTYARIWSTLETDTIRTKPAAALWVLDHLPKEYQPVLERARAICMGEAVEHWGDIEPFIQPCADFMLSEIEAQISVNENAADATKLIYLDKI